MTQRTQRRKMGILLALLLPITMLLSACKSDNTIEITSGGGMNFTMDMVDTDGLMASSGITCDMMSDLMSAEEPIPDGIFEVEDISQGDNLGCRFTISTPFAVDGNILVDDGDSYTLNLSSEDMGGADMSELDGLGPLEFTFNVTMPGPITDASEGGQINGNTVTFTDPKFLESGFSVTGQKSGNSSSGTSGNSDNEGSGSSSNASDSQSDGTSVWVWILIGVGVLAIIGGIIFLLLKRRGTRTKEATPMHPTGSSHTGNSPANSSHRVRHLTASPASSLDRGSRVAPSKHLTGSSLTASLASSLGSLSSLGSRVIPSRHPMVRHLMASPASSSERPTKPSSLGSRVVPRHRTARRLMVSPVSPRNMVDIHSPNNPSLTGSRGSRETPPMREPGSHRALSQGSK